MWAPLGNTWYDSLQIRATKRYSYGLDLTASYTWSKHLTTVEDQGGGTVPVNDVINRRNQKAYSAFDQPHIVVTGFSYRLWTPASLNSRAWTRAALTGWTFGGLLRYA